MKAIGTLTLGQYDEVKAAICPYCEVGLPEVRESSSRKWVHSIPRTDFSRYCEASNFRNKVGEAKNE